MKPKQNSEEVSDSPARNKLKLRFIRKKTKVGKHSAKVKPSQTSEVLRNSAKDTRRSARVKRSQSRKYSPNTSFSSKKTNRSSRLRNDNQGANVISVDELEGRDYRRARSLNQTQKSFFYFYFRFFRFLVLLRF